MSCKDCLQNCNKIYSDECVQYTGPAIPLLGVCTGESLSQLEADIIKALLSALDGTGINPANVTVQNCKFVKDQLGVLPQNLNNLLQVLINSQCTLKDLITAIQAQIAAGQDGTVIDTACLIGLPSGAKQGQIIQAIINLLCSVKLTVDGIPGTYVKITDLTNLVTPIVVTIINNSTTSGGIPQQNAKMVPYVSLEYYGPLSNFDLDGVGLSSLGYDKVYICNGENGTPDKRGRVAVGAIRGVPGGSLDPAVDPGVDPNNPNWGLKDKNGTNTVTLDITQIPTHTHIVNDPGHSHQIVCSNHKTINGGGGGFTTISLASDDLSSILAKGTVASTTTTGITIASNGGNQNHSNLQPSIAANFIMFIPS